MHLYVHERNSHLIYILIQYNIDKVKYAIQKGCHLSILVNGYKFVDLHIRGTQQYTLDDLRALRNELSYLLCCPPHHVLVNGIEPTNSIHITIMVPEDHVEFLFSIGEHEKSALHRLGVDSFKLDKKQIYCTGNIYALERVAFELLDILHTS